MQLLCLISIADIAWMKFYSESELYAAPLLYFYCYIVCMESYTESGLCTAPFFDCWHCLDEILSREWAMCSSFALFLLLILPAWNPIQKVSCIQLLYFISIADIACIKSYQGSKLCVDSLLHFHCWHCVHKISSSLWVICSSLAWFLWLTLPIWTVIQEVSYVQLLCLIFVVDIVCINFQEVSCMQLFCLIAIADIVWMKPYAESESCVGLLLLSITYIGCINFCPVGKSCIVPLLDFQCWHFLGEMSSRVWVIYSSSA